MKYFSLTALLAVLLTFAACQPPQQGLDAEDERNPYFRKAAKLAADGNFHGAISEYEKALQANPKVHKAHIEIGVLYADKLNDSIGACYHFQKYIDARPDAPNLAQVQTYLDKSEIDFALKRQNSPAQNAQEFAQISKENIELKQAVAQSQDALARKEEEIARLKSSLGSTTVSVPNEIVVEKIVPVTSQPLSIATNPVVTTLDAAKPAPTVQTPPAATPVTLDGAERVHVIQSGDNLWKIARKYYPNDINGGIEKIKQANPETTAKVQNLKLGQKLIIP